VILDTNALSAFADGDAALEPLLADCPTPLVLPAIVLGEYRYGISASRRQDAYEAWLAAALQAIAVLPVTAATTPHFAAIRSALRERGTPIPINDLWIAALAREYDLAVCSRDLHFDAVPGLRRLGW